jgi:hypothetical protein
MGKISNLYQVNQEIKQFGVEVFPSVGNNLDILDEFGNFIESIDDDEAELEKLIRQITN